MKLIYCRECRDVVRLRRSERRCECGRSRGRYVDEVNATISGPCVPLGVDNGGFAFALAHRPGAGAGRHFDAFVIAQKCPTISEEVIGDGD